MAVLPIGSFSPQVAVLQTLAIVASLLPKINPPVPLYAIVASDTLIPLTVPSSWGEFQRQYETQVSDYPVETGAFALYNKVRKPITINVSLTKAGSDVARFAWLAAIEQQEAQSPLQLYTIISPQGVFSDYTLTGLSHETRPDRGSNILHLSLSFTQVQKIPASAGIYNHTVEPKSSPVSQLGQLYTTVSNKAQDARINAQEFLSQ